MKRSGINKALRDLEAMCKERRRPDPADAGEGIRVRRQNERQAEQ